MTHRCGRHCSVLIRICPEIGGDMRMLLTISSEVASEAASVEGAEGWHLATSPSPPTPGWDMCDIPPGNSQQS